jgi:hypothetical protein
MDGVEYFVVTIDDQMMAAAAAMMLCIMSSKTDADNGTKTNDCVEMRSPLLEMLAEK